ncbi:hypothetical protein DICA4_D14378 [Diutina catenulata]
MCKYNTKVLLFLSAEAPRVYPDEECLRCFDVIRCVNHRDVVMLVKAMYEEGLTTWDRKPYAPYYYVYNSDFEVLELHSSSKPYSECTILNQTVQFESSDEVDRIINRFPWTVFEGDLFYDAAVEPLGFQTPLTIPEVFKYFGVSIL